MLIDCDNFFVSCERIFQPKLKNKPVIVLSNNDGCVVARSPEAKAAGIPMCSPFFKIEKQLKAAGGIALSSNYKLYADISSRVMSVLKQHFEKIEIYSIDEAFAHLSEQQNALPLAKKIREQILKEIGISVSIGIANTKTLCKLASEFAKKDKKICQISNTNQIDSLLAVTDVSEIWGVGRHITKKLNFMGIFNGLELKNADAALIRKTFGLNLEKTVRELNNISCLDISEEEHQKTIISSRSFEFEVKDKNKLQQIIAEFVDSACLRLRHQNAVAGGIMVSLSTNRFNLSREQYQNAHSVIIPQPSASTQVFMHAMTEALECIYRPCWYKKAGVMLFDIQENNPKQKDFFNDDRLREKENRLMKAFDALNSRFGKKSVYFGLQSSGIQHYIRRDFKSANYTTSWEQLIRVS